MPISRTLDPVEVTATDRRAMPEVAPAGDPAGPSGPESARGTKRAGRRARSASSRSYLSIVRANVFTVFNLIIGAFGVATLILGDPQDVLFVGVVVANSGIGIAQEVRAKRGLDRLSLLVAARATVEREGVAREVLPDQVVLDDVVRLAPGDQLVADGTLLAARDLRLDESVLTGESEAVARGTGEDVRSGAFVVEAPAPTASPRSGRTASLRVSPARHGRSATRALRSSVRSTACSMRRWCW
jgi:cation-transporting P-type ATPase E